MAYPPPPPDGGAAIGEAADEDPTQQPAPTDAPPLSPSQQLQYEELSTSLPATTVAHHGLQVLQAATAAPMDTAEAIAQQYAVSATMHVEGDGSHEDPNHHVYAPLDTTHLPHEEHHQSQLPSPATANQKLTRLRRACDMCSSRKVKCDESGPPCKPCRDLNVDCTFQREMKRRGPPNKHAEAAKAAKRARLGLDDDTGAVNAVDVVSAAPQIAAEALVSIAGQEFDESRPLEAEAIAPFPVLELLVDDFFTYIHPLCPFPHQPTFRQAFEAREDRTNRDFLALLATMIGVLVASFPRSARSHLKASHSTNLFPTAMTMIHRCRLVALEARGSMYMAKEKMTTDDAATSYFLGLITAYTMDWQLCKRFMSETMAFCRELGIHKREDPAVLASNGAAQLAFAARMLNPQRQTDHIKDQIGKRIFWVMVAGLRSMTQLGASICEIPLPPPTAQEPYPDLPLEVDDEYIFEDEIHPQPEGVTSLLTGFNRNTNIYMSMNELVGVDMCYGINFFEWSAQRAMLHNALQTAKSVTDSLPPALQVKLDPIEDVASGSEDGNLTYCPPAYPAMQPPNDLRHALTKQPERRRELQLEIQKANIYASQLATRSYFVERYLNLRDARGPQSEEDVKDEVDIIVHEERELIVQNLLAVLSSITQRNMEPNGASLVNKIRQVASTLLNDAPERKGPVAVRAEDYLGKFLEILVALEKSGTTSSSAHGTMTPRDEEEELKNWASLRQVQLKFAANGGFLGS